MIPSGTPTASAPSQSLGAGGSPEQAKLQTFTGSVNLPEAFVTAGVAGSFGDRDVKQKGGTLQVDLSLSETNARYESISFRTTPTTEKFSGNFSPSFGAPAVPMEMSVTFSILIWMSRASPELAVTPSSSGGFGIEAFASADCGGCFYMEITGTWTVKTPSRTYDGEVRSALTNRGMGVDTGAADIDLAHYPDEITLKNFSWHANSGGMHIPSLVDVTVEGVPLKLSMIYLDAPVARAESIATKVR